MGTVTDSLLAHMPTRAGFDLAFEDVRDAQVAAMNERFEEQSERIKVLAMRAKDVGISAISSREDAVALLLPHTAYKSYPESFLLDEKWDKLTRWLGTVSAHPTNNVDLSEIEGIDQWIVRLQDAGHYVSCSSGTTGKSAMLNSSGADIAHGSQDLVNAVLWGADVQDNQSRRFFSTGPVAAVPKNIALGLGLFQAFARTDVAPFISPAPPMTVGSITGAIVMRKRIADGVATPGEIAAFEESAAQRQKAMTDAIDAVVDAIIAAREDEQFLMGMWAGHYQVARMVRDRGFSAKDFNPRNALFCSGGLKRAQLPDDYREFVYETFNISSERTFLSYGMQEIQSNMPQCSHGRYHIPPWLVCLPLNENGDELLPTDQGQIEARAAFFDLSMEGRWGGVISGDKIEVDFGPCACGHASPSIADTITRYADIKGDDKIGCAGTVDAYVRGLS
ncbi:hypothetical protein [Novosphingobium sp. ZW T3_23]|uniref:hypothetical protein n=1 Tax=Novosphingobium sp. ZW T3_23 TaxID=3378084 RepID=UPI003852901C